MFNIKVRDSTLRSRDNDVSRPKQKSPLKDATEEASATNYTRQQQTQYSPIPKPHTSRLSVTVPQTSTSINTESAEHITASPNTITPQCPQSNSIKTHP
jgi:hypothetical protein